MLLKSRDIAQYGFHLFQVFQPVTRKPLAFAPNIAFPVVLFVIGKKGPEFRFKFHYFVIGEFPVFLCEADRGSLPVTFQI